MATFNETVSTQLGDARLWIVYLASDDDLVDWEDIGREAMGLTIGGPCTSFAVFSGGWGALYNRTILVLSTRMEWKPRGKLDR